ncbi:MAG: glycoside hydrolase family 3 N-terminal domain-containing protein [Bacteroides sp.]|jgi:beta-glucosidase|nr:glycoside hydrolase family 3 N-terminal domain-containing protein [Bacteroides sp.]
MRILLLIFLFFFMSLSGMGQPYRNPDLPVEERVQDLLSRMTPEEKFWQLFMIPGDLGDDPQKYQAGIFGFQVHTAGHPNDVAQQGLAYAPGSNAREMAEKINAIQRYFLEESRLGIPTIPFDEALHGLVREGATAFPQAIGLAASWNTILMYEVASAIARETRSRGIRQVLSPVVNIAGDVRWGRTEETYGEDPFLVTEMGLAFVWAFEDLGIITTPKHFVANVGDGGRDSYPIHFNERFLREIHFPPFQASIREGGARSIMTAYSSVDGTPATSNDWLLNKVLRDEWGFRGFVISDAGATGGANVLHMTAADYPDATANSIPAGLDVIFQTSYDHHELFMPPFLDGSIPQEVIDEAVARVLRMKFELGLFENPYVDPDQAAFMNGNPHHRSLALEAALQSIVLLKNDQDLLPLSKNIRNLAVIGPDAAEARLGGYSGPGNNPVSLLDGIKSLVGNEINIHYVPGCERNPLEFVPVPTEALSCELNGQKQNGLLGEYFSNVSWDGQPAFTRVDRQVDFQWTLFGPDPEKLNYDFFSVRWTGKIRAPETGTCRIGIDGNDGSKLYLDGKLLLDNTIQRGRRFNMVEVHFEEGREYNLQIEYSEPRGNAWFRLVWDVGVENEDSSLEEAVALAASSDVAIVVVGIEEGEFRDRALLGLSGRQEELIRRVAATGTTVVVILIAGSPVTMNSWMDQADAILAAWYPGEQGGLALAEALFGDYNPAGRLPVTWPVHEGQLPLVYNHKPTGRGDDYMNLTGQPLFPFGYGLSYTTFDYSDARLENPVIPIGDTAWASVSISNTGERAGDEVVQLYLRDELASVARPVMELKGFQRVHLKPGESTKVRFAITPDMLSMLDKDLSKVIEPGDFRIMIGASSRDIRQRLILKVLPD